MVDLYERVALVRAVHEADADQPLSDALHVLLRRQALQVRVDEGGAVVQILGE